MFSILDLNIKSASICLSVYKTITHTHRKKTSKNTSHQMVMQICDKTNTRLEIIYIYVCIWDEIIHLRKMGQRRHCVERAITIGARFRYTSSLLCVSSSLFCCCNSDVSVMRLCWSAWDDHNRGGVIRTSYSASDQICSYAYAKAKTIIL